MSTIDLPPDRYIGEASLDVNLSDYDTGASGAVAEDGVLNLIEKVEIVINGRTVQVWAPKRYWYSLPLDLEADPERVDLTAAQATGKAARFQLPIYFRSDPGNDDDLTALLPAHLVSTAQLRITWGTNAALGTDQTVQAATIKTTLKEYELTPAEEMALYGRSGEAVAKEGSKLLLVRKTESTHNVDAAYTNRGFEVDLPTGAILTRQFVFSQLAGARSDALVTDYEVARVSPFDERFMLETWHGSQQRDRVEYGIVNAIEGDLYLTGFTVLDYVDLESPLDLVGDRKGAVKLKATTAAPSGTTNLVILSEAFTSVAF